MQGIQLYFEELEEKLYISKTCEMCINNCKVRCISNEAEIYCKKYKKK